MPAGKRRKPAEEGPRLFLRGRYWAADLRPWGGARPTLRGSAGASRGQRTENKDTALKWAWEEISRLRSATHAKEWGIQQSRALGDAVTEYLASRKHKMAWNTWRNDAAALRHMLRRFGEARNLHSITQDELQEWFDNTSGYSPNTLALYAVLIRRFFDKVDCQLSRVETPVRHRDDPDPLADDEIIALQAACSSERERKLVNYGLATGGRKAELWALELGDFRHDFRSLRFQRQMAWPAAGIKGLKGKRSRTALVLPGFIEPRQRLGKLFDSRPSSDVATCLFRELLKRAGLYHTGRGMHVLRHTYARLGMERYEWSTEMVRVFLGHESITSVERYAHFGVEAAVRLAEQRTYS